MFECLFGREEEKWREKSLECESRVSHGYVSFGWVFFFDMTLWVPHDQRFGCLGGTELPLVCVWGANVCLVLHRLGYKERRAKGSPPEHRALLMLIANRFVFRGTDRGEGKTVG